MKKKPSRRLRLRGRRELAQHRALAAAKVLVKLLEDGDVDLCVVPFRLVALYLSQLRTP